MSAHAPEPHLFVVVGATGDLMDRKVLPALYAVHARGEIPPGSAILGSSRRTMSDAEFQELSVRALVLAKAGDEAAIRRWAAATLRYQTIGGRAADYPALAERVKAVESEFHLPGNRVFYLALPLQAFVPALEGIESSGLAKSPGWTRLVVEKPFGHDLASAQELNALIHRSFPESSVYRIDHYLGKETVQNLLVFRYANMFVEGLWNRQWVDHVQVTVAETVGVEGRAGYYDTAGALRDMVQNHLTQLLTLVAMEVPAAFETEAIRREKTKVLASVEPIRASDVVLGQYEVGEIEGTMVPAYCEEPGVKHDTRTETYAAVRLRVANWRWQGVPFLLRTGKRLAKKSTRVVITFRAPPITFFSLPPDYDRNPDRLTITVQPDEGFDLAFEIKVPGRETRLQTHRMRFRYADVFGPIRDAYETLILDIVMGDQTLFVGAEELEGSWRLYDTVLKSQMPVHPYAAGTNGPREADRLAEELGYRWNEE